MSRCPQNPVGIVLFARDDGVCASVMDALRSIGVNAISLPIEEEWPADVETILICGPFAPLSPAIYKIAQITSPRVILWYTEQTPSPDIPNALLRLGAGCSWCVNWIAEHLAQSAQISSIQNLVRRIHCLGTRLRLSGEIKWLDEQGYLKLLAVLTPSRQRYFAQKLGVPARVIPYGYDKSFGEPLGLERDIDVVFLGSLRDRRRSRIISDLEQKLDRHRIKFVIKDGSPTRGYAFNEERTQLLNRAKIMLNIMRQPWDDAVFRMLFAAPNGVMVISEPVVDISPFEPGKHFVVTSLEHMVETIQYYLSHSQERESFAQNGYDLVVNQLTMEKMVGVLLSEGIGYGVNQISTPSTW